MKEKGKKQKKGKVYIVGAGPMNARLITLKGIECIKNADVIYYDRLIDDTVLKYRREGVPAFFVGKSRQKTFSQDAVNRKLIEHARRGSIVVRLKGGDPFLFGRGAEEALLLSKAGVDFEIVNGVSSSFACPAFSGIPLTLRGISSAVTIITGQEDPYKEYSSVDWKKVWSPHHTLVILMGMANLVNIVRKLREAGAPGKTPVAVIQEGATVYQRVLQGTLVDIVQKVKTKELKAPAVIVIGEVVKMRKNLQWVHLSRLPLKGKTVLIASTRESFYHLKELLEIKGAKVIHFEGVRIVHLVSYQEMDEVIKTIDQYSWVVFTSKNGVSIFMERLKKICKDIRCLKGIKIAAIGPQTAERVRSYSLEPELVPKDFSSQGFIAAFKKIAPSPEKVLLARADRASKSLPLGLRTLGFELKNLTIYRVKRNFFSQKALTILLNKKIDMVVFTSSENARSFFTLVRKFHLDFKVKNIRLAGLGPPTKDTISKYGFRCVIPKKYRFLELAQCIAEELKND